MKKLMMIFVVMIMMAVGANTAYAEECDERLSYDEVITCLVAAGWEPMVETNYNTIMRRDNAKHETKYVRVMKDDGTMYAGAFVCKAYKYVSAASEMCYCIDIYDADSYVWVDQEWGYMP